MAEAAMEIATRFTSTAQVWNLPPVSAWRAVAPVGVHDEVVLAVPDGPPFAGMALPVHAIPVGSIGSVIG